MRSGHGRETGTVPCRSSLLSSLATGALATREGDSMYSPHPLLKVRQRFKNSARFGGSWPSRLRDASASLFKAGSPRALTQPLEEPC